MAKWKRLKFLKSLECIMCHRIFPAIRYDADCCGGTCRMRRHRQRKAAGAGQIANELVKPTKRRSTKKTSKR